MEAPKAGLLDLEKELTCSICTEVLYQPLTLLDCLHTFCGSCLNDWFKLQASQARRRRSNPYTCPSCRSSVRETRPNATVTTLLDMFVQANPDKGRTAQEKEELVSHYKPGDDVMPIVSERSEEEQEEEQDARMIEEIRELSLREAGVRGPRSYERGTRHRTRSIDRREEDNRQRRRRDGQTSAQRTQGTPSTIDSRSQARQIEHQSSLRSLLSTSEVDSAEMEEEILRQITEEGLLDGIDLENLDASQEDQLSERIAEAYRRRHRPGPRTRESRNEGSASSQSRALRSAEQPPSARRNTRSTGNTDPSMSPSHIPVSRLQLLEAYPIGYHRRRSASRESRRQSSPVPGSSPVRRDAARSATDLSNRPQTSATRERRPSEIREANRRATTDARPRRLSEDGQRRNPQAAQLLRPRNVQAQSVPVRAEPPPRPAVPSTSPRRGEFPPTNSTRGGAEGSDTPRSPPALEVPESPVGVVGRPSSSSSSTASAGRARPTLYAEPSITCNRCGKLNLEYELHENCAVCNNGSYHVCHSCYRLGLGCLHWFGFGPTAWNRFQQVAAADESLPHSLVGHRYLPPKPESLQPSGTTESPRMSTEDPSKRLQSGAFCSNCSTFANDCFWLCNHCNDGEWGYCNRCVNRGKCCTHPLLPMAQVSATRNTREPFASSSNQHSEASLAPITSPRMVQAYPATHLASSCQYRPLTFSTNCDICHYPVQPSQTRFHCYECNEGDYDICTSCYAKLVSLGRIGRENGERGWRRCLRGHRMILVGFEDSVAGQMRVVVRDLVGGYALKDEARNSSSGGGGSSGSGSGSGTRVGRWTWRDGEESHTRTFAEPVATVGSLLDDGATAAAAAVLTSPTGALPMLQRYPPDGGVGLKAVACWPQWPRAGATDELAFPRGAEIREVEDINGDWYLGYYCGVGGLFPAPYVSFLEGGGRGREIGVGKG